MSSLALLLLMPLLAWGLPGYLLSRWLIPNADPLERGLTALMAGIVTVAPTTYLLVLLFKLAASPALIGIVSLLWVIIAVALQRWQPLAPNSNTQLGPEIARFSLLFAISIAAITSLSTTPLSIETVDVWWHCPHLSSLYLMEDGSGPGVVAWDPVWQRSITHLFQHPTEPAFGLGPALMIQRPGNAAFLLQLVAFLSTGGLVVAVFCTDFLIVGFSMLMLGRVSRNTVLNTCVAVVFLFGVRALAAYQVNENTIGLALSMGLLHLVTRNGNESIPKAWAVAAAVILGHLAGIRPVTLLLIPAALLLMRGSKVMRAIFVGSVLVAMSPWLVAHGQAFGNAVHHPALEYGHQTQTLLTETPLEVNFTFHPLNYPFAEQWVRPPTHPYPTNLRLPLELLQAFGAPFLALVICGLVGMWILRRRRDLLGLVLWILPVPLILAAIVSLDYQKLSYVLLALAPLPFLAGVAFSEWSLNRSWRVAVLALVSLVLIVGPGWVRNLELPVDHRKHADFLRDRRDDQSDSERRAKLTRPSFGPYIAGELDFSGAAHGWSLLSHSRMSAATRKMDDVITQNPVVVWAALSPAGLNHKFALKSADSPQLPPNYFGTLSLPGVGINSGRIIFVIQLPAGSPQSAELQLTRKGQSYQLSIKGLADSGVSEKKSYLSVLIVDRNNPSLTLPSIELFGKKQAIHSVTLWDQQDERFVAQPRSVANFEWGIVFDGKELRVGEGRGQPVGVEKGLKPVCRGAEFSLFEYCPDKQCMTVLSTLNGLPRGIRMDKSTKALTWGPGYPTPENRNDACTQRFFAQ